MNLSCTPYSFVFFQNIFIYTLLIHRNKRNKESMFWTISASLCGTGCNAENWVLYINYTLISSQGNGFISQLYFGS